MARKEFQNFLFQKLTLRAQVMRSVFDNRIGIIFGDTSWRSTLYRLNKNYILSTTTEYMKRITGIYWVKYINLFNTSNQLWTNILNVFSTFKILYLWNVTYPAYLCSSGSVFWNILSNSSRTWSSDFITNLPFTFMMWPPSNSFSKASFTSAFLERKILLFSPEASFRITLSNRFAGVAFVFFGIFFVTISNLGTFPNKICVTVFMIQSKLLTDKL